MNARGFAPAARFVRPNDPISSRNFPRPQYGGSFATTNLTIVNRNYAFEAAHYRPHVANFYGWQSPGWGNHWRWGFAPSVSFGISFGVGVGFGFGFYAYDPFYAPVVASPWYYDPYVPAYIPEARVAVWSGYSVAWSEGEPYRYVPADSWNSYGDPQLNYCISDLHTCYTGNHPELIDDMMGSGQVAIFSRGHYEYSLGSTDFRAMMADNCAAGHTVAFDVLSVRHHGPWAWVRVRQKYRTEGGEIRSVYLVFRLNRLADRYAITDFMTSETLM